MAITKGNRYRFLFGTLAEYTTAKDAGLLNNDHLYFITDTRQLYVGEDLYTGQVSFVDEFPTSPSQGIIYCNNTTHETKVWNGASWNIMIPPIQSTLTVDTADTDLVNAKAIRDYITNEQSAAVNDVEYDSTTQTFTVTYFDDTTSSLPLKNLITGASYNGTTGNFTFTQANGEDIVVNTPVENFLSSASFDKNTNTLTLTLTDGTEVTVDLAELVDTYTVKSTSTVELAMSDSGEITANVIKSESTGNALVLNTDGLFVPIAPVQTVTDTSTITFVLANNDLSGNVQVSTETDNIISIKTDGLYVPKTDLSDYYTKEQIDTFTTWYSIE